MRQSRGFAMGDVRPALTRGLGDKECGGTFFLGC
jgi:hypothetical protein